MIELRGSFAPVVMNCGQALFSAGIPKIETSGIPAKTGTAAHEALAMWVNGERNIDTEAIALHYGVDPKEVKILLGLGVKLWEGVLARDHGHGGKVNTEQRLEVMIGDIARLTGTADVLSVKVVPNGVTVAYVDDWKTGRLFKSYREQLGLYALIVWYKLGLQSGDKVQVRTVWVREAGSSADAIETEIFTERDIADYASKIHKYAQAAIAGKSADVPYSPGEHCMSCPRLGTCEAHSLSARKMLTTIGWKGTFKEVDMKATVEAIAKSGRLNEALQAAKDVGKIADNFISEVKTYVRVNGPVPIADKPGKALAMCDKSRTTVDTLEAWPVLKEHFDAEQMASVVTVSLTKVKEEAGAIASHGEKGKAAMSIVEQLDNAGALRKFMYQEMRAVNYDPPKPSDIF